MTTNTKTPITRIACIAAALIACHVVRAIVLGTTTWNMTRELEVTLDVKTVRHDTLKVAERCEAELGDEQWSFITGSPRDWGHLPIPDGPITVGIDGGYVRNWEAKQHHCEVIVGKSTLAFKRDEFVAEFPCGRDEFKRKHITTGTREPAII